MTEEKQAAPQSEEKIDRTFPNVTPGTTVKVHQEIVELNAKGEEKKRIQIYEGIVLARKHGEGINATITVRKMSDGIGVEKIFPLNSPNVKKIETVKKIKVRRAKLNHLRGRHKKAHEIKEQ